MIRAVLDCIHVYFYVLIIFVFCDKFDPIPNLVVEFSEFVQIGQRYLHVHIKFTNA